MVRSLFARKRRATEPGGLGGSGLPTLTVVMPVFDVAPYVREAALSVLGQDGVDVTLVVVDDGSRDGTWRILSKLARRHPRLVLARQEHAGQGAARNHGLGLASGTYLAFADGDDVVPPGAYAAMVGSLESSGSDLCLGGVRRFDTERAWEPAWSREVHAQDRTAVTLEEYLPAIKDILACNRVMRRAFWDRVEARFPEGVVYEDHWPMLHTLVSAGALDILAQPVYHWRARPDGSSTGQQKHLLQNLLDRLTVKADAWERLQAASDAVRQAWVGRVLDVDLPPFLNRALDADDTYRTALAEALARYTALATLEAWEYVRGQNRARALLGAAGRWDDLQTLAERTDGEGLRALTGLEGGVVRLRADVLSAPELPPWARELPAWQSSLSARLRKTAPAEGGLSIHGVLAVEGLRVGAMREQARATLELPGPDGGTLRLPVDLRPRQVRRPENDGPVEDVVTLGFRVLVPAEATGGPAAAVTPRLHLQVGDLRREARIRVPDGLTEEAVRGAGRDASGFLTLSRPGYLGGRSPVATAPDHQFSEDRGA